MAVAEGIVSVSDNARIFISQSQYINPQTKKAVFPNLSAKNEGYISVALKGSLGNKWLRNNTNGPSDLKLSQVSPKLHEIV